MSRNLQEQNELLRGIVAPREGRVSRNCSMWIPKPHILVAPREGRVSRNIDLEKAWNTPERRAPRGACE